ncbi:trigger factor [Calothrix sp. PCC 6303]|uniref:trigger factor n=1 Tax=Calothrix sp. PCC 6303 TaxID=1170562 RepID=UPI0002A020AC|nr:trigger factor [Calothrix sp. PCC 6303]AFZ02379.1 Trigger factor [Calothrix sp. PCC 6303]
MKVTQEKLPASQIGLEIEVTPETTKQTYEQVVKNLSRTVNIPGFRKGKVPRAILLQRLGSARIKATALEEIIQDGINQAIKQEDIPAIGQPQLRSSFDDLVSGYEPGQPLTFSAAVDVQPEIKVNKYTGLEIKAEEIKVDPERVDKTLDDERQQMATLIPVQGRPAQLGDVAVVDFKGVIPKAEGEEGEDEPISGGEATDFQVELQEDRFIPGFVTGMIGMNPEETREISAQFPDPYANPDLAGKAARFTVTLKEIKEKELPELNDDFAKEVSEYETLAELRSSLEQQYQKEAEDRTKSNKQEAFLKELLNHIEADLPETIIDKEIDAMLMQTAMRLQQQGLDVRKLFTQDVIPRLRDNSREEAIERVKRSLSLREIGKLESIKVSEAEIEARVQELKAEYADQDVDEDRLRSMVENDLLTDKIFDWLFANSTVELVAEGSLAPKEEPEVTENTENTEGEENPEATEPQ